VIVERWSAWGPPGDALDFKSSTLIGESLASRNRVPLGVRPCPGYGALRCTQCSKVGLAVMQNRERGARSWRMGRGIFCAAIAGFVLFALFTISRNVDPSTLSLYDPDENAFLIVLDRMFNGFVSGNLRDALNISFFNYGYGFFFPLLILSSPALALKSYGAAIFIARATSVLATIALMLVGAKYIRERTGGWWWPLCWILALLAMPGFVRQSLWVHPEPLMNLGLIVAVLTGVRASLARRGDLLLCAVAAGFALSAKFQTLIYLPFVFAAPVLRASMTGEPGTLVARIWAAAKTGAVLGLVCVVTYLILDPFMLHPVGQHEFYKDLQENIASNKTNHFRGIIPTSSEKFRMLGREFFPIYLSGLVTMAGLVLTWLDRRNWRNYIMELAILGGAWITAAYIFLTVNKTWPHYYITSYVWLALAVLAMIGANVERLRAAWPALVSVGVTGGVALLATIVVRADDVRRHFPMVPPKAKADALQLAELVRPHMPPQTKNARMLISPNTSFAATELGLRISRVQPIAGPLTDEDLKGVDLLVIRKDDIYFSPAQLRRDDAFGEGARHARGLLDGMLVGRNADMRLCAQNDRALVFCGAKR